MVARRARSWLAGLAVGAASGSCLPTPVYRCEANDACADLGVEARCEPEGYCSEADAGCTSGRRFHAWAGEGLADRCTDVRCGDGVMQADELCDDGNDIEGDGCNGDCRPSGQEQWKVGYASPGDVPDRCYSVVVDSHGDITLIGEVGSTDVGQNLWVRQYDPSGEARWTWVLDGDAHLDEEGWSVVLLENDELLVVGYVTRVDTGGDLWLGRIDHEGILQWSVAQDGGQAWGDAIRDVTFAPDGDLVAIGYATTDLDRETDLWFERRSPDGQLVRWTQHRDGLEDDAQDRAHGIAAIAGGYVGVGMKQTTAGQRFWVESFDEMGRTRWTDEAAADDPQSVWTAVAALPSGDVLLAGWRAAAAGDTDMWLQRRAADGNVVWDEIVASPGHDDDKANVLLVDERGGFLVGGEMGAGAGSTDAWIRRYDANRNEVWTFGYSGPAGDRDTTWGLAFAPDGAVVACGYESSPGTDWDLWVRRITP